jgi:hypothetical protein
MTGNSLLDFAVPLLFGLSFGIAGQQIRIYLKDRRARRIIERLLN